MSAFRDIMSIVDPTAAKTSTASKQAAPGVPKPVPRSVGGVNGTSQAPQLKRKASGLVETTQVKIQRKEGMSQVGQTNGAGRASSTPAVARPNPSAPLSTVAYRGTAAPTSSKTASPLMRKPIPITNSASVAPKAPAPAPKPAPAGSTVISAAAPKKGYLALLQKAKEKDATKPVAPPLKHEPTKFLSKKERLALKAEASTGAKGKKPVAGGPAKSLDPKADSNKEKRKPVEVGYQGTARPTKKPVEVGYKGTARPGSAATSSNRNGASATKAKANPAKARPNSYINWSDVEDEGDMDDEEDDYDSDGSSDMEGGVWDVEQEEQLALKAAKKEDAAALAEEMEAKRAKEERKKKLAAMSKAAAAKKKY